MTPEAWTFAGTSVTTFAGLVIVFVQNRRQHTENRDNAERLRAKVEPVSNGFASHVLASLDRIEGKVDAHIGDHQPVAPRQRKRSA